MKYLALAKVEFGPGTRLILTKEQAVTRRHVLTTLGDDHYETLGLVQFKAGEEFGVVGDIAKAQQPLLEKKSKPAKADK